MYSNGSFNQPEYLQLDMEMEETLTNSPREQQLIPNGDQGTFAQDMGMAPRYLSEFEFIGQQQEQYEYTVLEDPQVFNEEQEDNDFDEELYDDYTHEYRSMGTDVQGTYGVRIIDNRGHVTQETNEYIPNGRQMTHNDVNFNLNQRYGHGQMTTESRFQSQNHFIDVEDQYCSEDDIYGMPNGVQGFDHGFHQQFPNGIQYHLHQGQASSSRAASMASESSSGSSSDMLQSSTYELKNTTRHRTKFEKWQIDYLEERFEQSDSYSKKEMMVMAEELGLSSVDQVKFWFKNRKQKRTKELKEKNQADHQGHPGSVQSTQMLNQSPASGYPTQTFSSVSQYHPYDNSFMAPSPINSQMSSQCHPQNEDPMQPLRRVSKTIEDWQVKVLEHKFAGKFSSTKAQNEEAARELNLTIDQVKYFMRKKRLNKRDN
ncbi:hypothetical protein CAEBREN_17609 [Caenorhabditis brenneri]|uniref:Homeobox domain-containing protein n=1 Tax=Caenorhabditis brenneri TaxID=135651 RepID=G0NQ66_CAEBE|nr:hypothetical protein CAEBREN_17609 [Caenorhabditis brenneri]